MPGVRRKTKPKRINVQLLTRRISTKVKHLEVPQRKLFKLWLMCKKVEHLPEGMPYKVTNKARVRSRGATFVRGLGTPMILVSDLLSRAERQNVARHELHEWKLVTKGKKMWPAHKMAIEKENQKLRDRVLITDQWFNGMRLRLGIEKAEKLTRKDYLKWLDSPESLKKVAGNSHARPAGHQLSSK